MTARRISILSLAYCVAFSLVFCSYNPPAFAADQAAKPEPATAQQFKTIAGRLDTGGDLYLIVNLDGTIRQLMDLVAKFAEAAPATDKSCPQNAAETVKKLQAFLEDNGVYALQGLGMSSVPRPDGMYSLKIFLTRDPASQDKPLWRGIVGSKPRRLASLDFLPADSALARACNAEPDQLWQMIKTGVNQVLAPQQAECFNKVCAQASAKLGVDLDKLMQSMGDESFLSIQLSPTNKLVIPSQTGPVTIPEPSFVLGCKLKDNTLPDMLDALLATNMIPVLKLAVGGDVLRSVMMPPTLPVKWQPAYTTHAGYLLIGSSPNAIMRAVTAFEDKSGLTASPEFTSAFEGLPMVNNGVEYVSPRFTEAIVDFQTRMLEAQAAAIPAQASVNKTLLDLVRKSGTKSGAFVLVNLQSGVLLQGNSSSGGKEAFAAMAAAPIGMMAAIAVPSFMKARGNATRNACIGNLRQIDAAKEQWALEQGKAAGDEVDAEALKAFLRSNVMPTCPKGGTYKLNAIGTKPECSIPGHSLDHKPGCK